MAPERAQVRQPRRAEVREERCLPRRHLDGADAVQDVAGHPEERVLPQPHVVAQPRVERREPQQRDPRDDDDEDGGGGGRADESDHDGADADDLGG